MNIPLIFWIVPAAAVIALAVAWAFYRSMKREDEGTPRMREIAAHVRKGAMAYLRQQYKVVGIVFVNVVKILVEVVNVQIVVVDLGIVIKLVIDLSVLVFDELIVLGLLRGFLRSGLARGLFRGLCGLGLLGGSLACGGRRAGLLLGLGLLAGLGCLLGCRRFLRGQNCSS